MASDVLEIEIDERTNASLHFAPLQRRVRGRFDYMRVPEPLAKQHLDAFPAGVPGQRLGINFKTGEAWLDEPLRLPEFEAVATAVKNRGCALPERETFELSRKPNEAMSVPTWAYWMKRAVESGLARVVKGELPKEIDGEPLTRLRPPAEKSQAELLSEQVEAQTAAINAQTAALTKLVELLAKK